MGTVKIDRFVIRVANELGKFGVKDNEALERAKNIAQFALFDRALNYIDVYEVISPSPVVVGIIDPRMRARAARAITAIWLMENASSAFIGWTGLVKQLGFSPDNAATWMRERGYLPTIRLPDTEVRPC
jgi:hypothetical protein